MNPTRALIDTNILIHRETKNPIIAEIGTLFFWLEKLKYKVCIHPITNEEILGNADKKAVEAFQIKMQSYQLLRVPKELHPNVEVVSKKIDQGQNDINDTKLLDEVFCDRVDILITEDKKIHSKAKLLGIDKKVFTVNGFLDYVKQQVPGLVAYDVLEIQKKFFSDIEVKDNFFDTLRSDYSDFDKWFSRKAGDGEEAYVLHNDQNKVEAFLYLKVEDTTENYGEITPVLEPKKRLKVGTFKVAQVGKRLGERFLKVIFDNAKQNNVEEIYVTVFDHADGQRRLIELLKTWGFVLHGSKKSGELVYCRSFTRKDNTPVNRDKPKKTYPYISQDAHFYVVPILPEFHTDLFPDSLLRGEDRNEFIDAAPHRNAITKCYISSAKTKNLKSGDALVFYRTGGQYKGVATTIGIVESIVTEIKDEEQLIELTENKTVFNEEELREYFRKRKNWSKEYKPFVVTFLYVVTLKKRPNLKQLIELNIIDKAPRGFVNISKESFGLLIRNNI